MALDFSGLGGGNSVDTVLPPREIFSVLPRKATQYQYPRDVQSEVLEQWFARRNEKDIIIKMNTGSGKTVVGLLILKSCLNEKRGPAVYVAPDTYLVKQVLSEAARLGLATTEDPRSSQYLMGQSILVINIHKLINGKSVFGVAEEGSKIDIGSIIIDDAHACLSASEAQFTLTISASAPAYNALLTLFRDDLYQQSNTGLLEIENREPIRNMLVPYWAWIDRQKDVGRILFDIRAQDDIMFIWPLIKDSLPLCRCVFNGNEIEISPRCLPIDAIPSFVAAKRRIMMSATLSDDSILVSDFNISEKSVKEIIVPKSANDIGDRMILVPQQLNPNITEGDLKEFFSRLAKKYNVVIIVPSAYRADYWSDVAAMTLTATNLYEGVDRLKEGHLGLVVMINKYDGIDLPYDACRILVIDNLPDVRRRIDRIEQSVLSGSAELLGRNIQRIEQGMGRGVRSNDDHCVVFLMGGNLSSTLFTQDAFSRFTPTTRAQMDLSMEVSKQIQWKNLNEIEEVINYCLDKDEKWLMASKGALVHIKYPAEGFITPFVLEQRKAFDCAQIGQFAEAIKSMQQAVNSISEKRMKGWLQQQLAEYTHFIDPVESQEILKSAVGNNRYVLKPRGGISYTKLMTHNMNQARQASDYLKQYEENLNKLIVIANGYIDELEFRPETAFRFEHALAMMAYFIGFKSQRPEAEFGKGPDVLWETGELRYFIIECKNGAVVDTIAKDYCNQLNGSMLWFKEKYDSTCVGVPIMVHPANRIEYSATLHESSRIITAEKLKNLKDAFRKFVTALASRKIGDPEGIAKLLDAFSLTADKFIKAYTVDFKTKR